MEQIFGGGILWTLLIGFLAGLLARALKPGDDKLGFFMTIVLGILGALLARFVGVQLGWYGPGEPAGFIAAVEAHLAYVSGQVQIDEKRVA